MEKKSAKKSAAKVPAKKIPTLVKGDVVQICYIHPVTSPAKIGFVRKANVENAYVYIAGEEDDAIIGQREVPRLIESNSLVILPHVDNANILHVTVVADEMFNVQHVAACDSNGDSSVVQGEGILAKVDGQKFAGVQYLLDEYIRARLVIDHM